MIPPRQRVWIAAPYSEPHRRGLHVRRNSGHGAIRFVGQGSTNLWTVQRLKAVEAAKLMRPPEQNPLMVRITVFDWRKIPLSDTIAWLTALFWDILWVKEPNYINCQARFVRIPKGFWDARGTEIILDMVTEILYEDPYHPKHPAYSDF